MASTARERVTHVLQRSPTGLTVTMCANQAGVSHTTALKYLSELVQQGKSSQNSNSFKADGRRALLFVPVR